MKRNHEKLKLGMNSHLYHFNYANDFIFYALPAHMRLNSDTNADDI